MTTKALFSVLFGCIVLLISPARSETITVSNTAELEEALEYANSIAGNSTILLRDGTYTLTGTLWITAPNVTIAAESGSPEKVIIQGDAMSSTARVGNIFTVAASHFQLRDVTLQNSRWHLIQVKGENDADYLVVRNCILRDAYQQLLKVTLDPGSPSVTSDNGLVENCVFEYSAGIGPQYYIGGIDAHGSRNWSVRNNTFRYIISPSQSTAEFAVHFWNGSADNIVEKNLIFNCDRGIGFGMDGRPNTGGIIRNNMIYHSENAGSFDDTGIALIESPETEVYNNTLYMENDFPWAIEYRFPSTRNVLIANNLANKQILSRDDASGTVSTNVTAAQRSWFVSPSSGDLHLATSIADVLDSGQTIPDLMDDFDSQSRPQGAGIDIGADELSVNPDLPKPENLRILDQ